MPVLKRVDVIVGTVTGPVADKDRFTAPDTRVVRVLRGVRGRKLLSVTYPPGRLDKLFYVRLRGTEGNRTQPGLMGRLCASLLKASL
jgi:hypothetical protein